jgi:probable addiction module antidote protein
MIEKKTNHRDLQDFLKNHLQNPQEAAAYLKAALADEDERVFLLAVRDVLQARGQTVADFAQEHNLNKQNLYRMFSQKSSPRLTSLLPVLDAIGFQMDISPIKK